MKRIKYLLLALIICSSPLYVVGCGEKGLKRELVPDYSSYEDQFDFYAYSSVYNGYFTIDGEKYYTGESFLTLEQYQMYKDCGFNIVYPQSTLKIDTKNGREEGFEKLKTEVDKFVSIGLDKTIVYDEDLSWLGLKPGGLIGEGKDYPNEDALDEKVYEYVSLYADYPGIYGVSLADEPKDIWCTSYGEVYKSIKRVNEKYGYNLYIDYNLNPLNRSKLVYEEYYPYVEGTGDPNPITGSVNFEDCFLRYKQYIYNFLDSMDPDYIRYDHYPLRNGYMLDTFIPCIQFIAETARDRGIEFHMVNQSFDMNTSGSHSTRRLTENGAKWLNNMLLGFGVREISYFTYYTRNENRSDGESFIDGGSFVTLYGQPTNIYYFMKEIMGDNQKFAPTILQFDYRKSGVFTKLPLNYPAQHLQYVEQNVVTFDKIKSIEVNKECAMINELYDKENDRYMYMAMNIVDPDYKGSNVYQTITLEFDKEYNYALVYRDGDSFLYKLNDSKINVKGGPGEASFIIPFK